ncbi:hypothetical protein QQX13_09365 [Demequina sp. SYSU T00068]|uniref:hypothetical protein n=1 Tax=Demequina lignilytica TaxID=3051663 RepID=UPI002630DC41|nr:hypothetical protein [Demequina sp. SYSU T00068]MDN4491037.1 hypothetical protein [Demequina sp. SYSU T00068]
MRSTSEQVAREPWRAVETYRNLRMLLVALPLLLLLSSLALLVVYGSLEGSISEYYGTLLQDVFVGAMVATGVCLVAYKGNPLEDYALNVAGFYALMIAFVPTGFDSLVANPPPGTSADELLNSLRIVLVLIVLGAGVYVLVELKYGPPRVADLSRRTATKVWFWITQALQLVFLVVLGLALVRGTGFQAVHMLGAVFLIVGFATAIASHVWPEPLGGTEKVPRGRYGAILVAMIAGLPVVFALRTFAHWEHAILAIEWWEISLFAVYWVLEMKRTWTVVPGT